MSNIIVTTGDLHKDYQVLGPVYFQVSNKGLFSSALGKLKEKYKLEIQSAKKSGCLLYTSLGQIDLHFDDEINVVKGDQEQQEFPATSVQLLAKNVGVVKGDDAFPALVSHLFEDHPGCH